VLKEEMSGKELNIALHHIKRHLEKTDFVLQAGRHFVNPNIHSHSSIFANQPIDQLGNDGTLAAEEMHYLKDLRNDLALIKKGLYADETGQENPNFSVDAFNEIIRNPASESKFRTQHQAIPLDFQMVELENTPVRIHKWAEKNRHGEQNNI